MTNLVNDEIEAVARAIHQADDIMPSRYEWETIMKDNEHKHYRREVISKAKAAITALDKVRGGEPVAYRVKDFADGWVLVDSKQEAEKIASGAGNLVQPLYLAPSVNQEMLEALKIVENDRDFRDHCSDKLQAIVDKAILSAASGKGE
jgi:hypothetical protein